MKKITIAIDGFSSCGKSTLARALAKALGYAYVDSGAMYRAITWYFLENDIALDNAKAIKKMLGQINIEFRHTPDGNHTFLNGQDIENEIRKMRVSDMVSEVAAISQVRRALVRQQQAMGQKKGIVMDGRDIGTVVFPDAELKIFLTADPEIRTLRRYNELKAKGVDIAKEKVRKNLQHRDRIDATRQDSPLTKAADAVTLDNSLMNQEEQLQKALQLARERLQQIAD